MRGWKRTYWAVWVANAVTAVGMMSFLPYFPGHLQELGLTDRGAIATWSGAIFGAAPLVAAFMSPIWGALGDRFGRKLMVVRSMLGISLFVGCMAFVSQPLHLLFLRVGQGLFAGFVAPSLTLVSIQAPANRHGRITGSLQTALAVGAIFGPLIGGLASAGFGLRPVFLGVCAVSFLSAVLVMLLAQEDAGQRRSSSEASIAHVFKGAWADIRDVWRNRRVRAALILIFWIQFGIGATNPLLELHVADLGFSGERLAQLTGLLFSMMAVINLFAMPLWGRYGDRAGHGHALTLCAVGCALALGLHAAASFYALLLAARLALGASMAGSGPCAFGLAAAEISVDRRGGAFGVVFSARALAVSSSAMLGGYLSQLIGIRGLFLLGGLLAAAAAWLVFASTRDRARAT